MGITKGFLLINKCCLGQFFKNKLFISFKADEVDRKNVFKVHHKNVRVYLFQAESEESMNRCESYFKLLVN